ncbi:LysR family transcriptional regulator [Chitinimonas naiadis]
MRLPSTQSLGVFVAVARHLSFSAAADELGITHSAVSQQLAKLEQVLGVRLLARKGRQQVQLTPEGLVFRPEAEQILARLSAAVGKLRATATHTLHVTAPPSLLTRWLLPRVASFSNDHPDIALLLHADKRVLDLVAEGFHLAIRYCRPESEYATPYLLAQEWLSPVAQPGYGHKHPGESARLLMDDFDGWDRWTDTEETAAVPTSALATPAITITDSAMLLQVCEDGHGIALGRRLLVADALQRDKLACLVKRWVPARGAYYLALAPGAPEHEPTVRFVKWLRREMEKALPLDAERHPAG